MIDEIEKHASELAKRAEHVCQTPSQGIPRFYGARRNRAWWQSMWLPGEECAADYMRSLPAPTAPRFIGDTPVDNRPAIIGFHLTTSDGSLFMAPEPPEGAISSIRRFNNTSYYYGALDGTGRLQCHHSDKTAKLTETRPYIDLAGGGVVVTVCTSVRFARAPTVDRFASGIDLGVFCADVQIPISAVEEALGRMRFADMAIVEVDEAKSPTSDRTTETTRTATRCTVPACQRHGRLRLSEADMVLIARNVYGERLRHGSFKVGGEPRPDLFAMVIGRRTIGTTQERYQVLVLRLERMGTTVGANVVLAGLFLFGAAALLVLARGRSEERTVREIHRALQVGVVRTGVYLRRRRTAVLSRQLEGVAESLRGHVERLAEVHAAAKQARSEVQRNAQIAVAAKHKEQEAITRSRASTENSNVDTSDEDDTSASEERAKAEEAARLAAEEAEKAEAKARKAKELVVRTAVDHALGMVSMDHPYERVEDINSLAASLLSVSPEGGAGTTASEPVILRTGSPRAPYVSAVYGYVQAARARGRATEYFVYRKIHGQRRLLRFVGAPVRMPDGTYQTYAIVEVVTAEQQRFVESELASSGERHGT